MTETPPTKKVATAKKTESEANEPEQGKPAATKKDTAKSAASKAAARAATLIRLARTLERSGKTEQALANYREVVKDYPNTLSAKTAAERIKAIGKD